MAYRLTPQERETLRTYNTIAPEYNGLSPDHWKDGDWYDFVSLMKGDLVLDLGCGTARDTGNCISDGLRYVGVDLSLGMLNIGKKDFADVIALGQAALLNMSMYELAFRTESFDGFRAVTSFVHIPRENLPSVLAEIYRVLKPQGVGFISVPHGTFNDMYQALPDYGKTLCVCWLKQEFEPILEKAGFVVRWCYIDEPMLICMVEKLSLAGEDYADNESYSISS